MISNSRIDALARIPHRRSGLSIGEFVLATGIFSVIAIVGIVLFLPVTRSARPAANRSQCKNNLKQIGLALHNYHEKYQAFPPAYTVDADGKPLHSWRTLILPYMDQEVLYSKIDLTKPWDDSANAEAFKTTIWAYRCPSAMGPETHTTYLAVVTSNSCLRPGESARISDIKDGTSNTLLVIEVASEHAVPWMAPTDAEESSFLVISSTSKVVHTGGAHALLADGTVRFLNDTMSAEIRRALISIDGNESLPDF